jgi:hypothetical protein
MLLCSNTSASNCKLIHVPTAMSFPSDLKWRICKSISMTCYRKIPNYHLGLTPLFCRKKTEIIFYELVGDGGMYTYKPYETPELKNRSLWMKTRTTLSYHRLLAAFEDYKGLYRHRDARTCFVKQFTCLRNMSLDHKHNACIFIG